MKHYQWKLRHETHLKVLQTSEWGHVKVEGIDGDVALVQLLNGTNELKVGTRERTNSRWGHLEGNQTNWTHPETFHS